MKIITALNNMKINEKLKGIKEIEIIGKDIIYQEAVLDILKTNKDINYLFLNINLLGELNKIEFIKKIIEKNKKIKIIIYIKNKNKKIKNQINEIYQTEVYSIKELKINNILKILSKNEKIFIKCVGKKEICNSRTKHNQSSHNTKKRKKFTKLRHIQKTKKITQKIVKNILVLNKKILKLLIKIFNKNIFKIHGKKNEKKIIKYKTINNYLIKQKNIITVSGAPGVGKSILIINMLKLLKNQKILILDFDYSINSILNIKSNKTEKYKIINYNKNIDILNLKNTCINEDIINKLFCNYEIVFVDLSNNMEINKKFIKKDRLNVIIVEPNLLGIYKTNSILEEYNYLLKNNYKKINIIFNKYEFNSIKINILKIIYSKYKIIGKINYDNNFNKIINNKFFKINKKNIRNIEKIINKCILK